MDNDEALARTLAELDTELEQRTHPRPHDSLPETLAPGSNVAYVSKEENDRLVRTAIALGLGRFRVKTEHEHRLDLECDRRRRA